MVVPPVVPKIANKTKSAPAAKRKPIQRAKTMFNKEVEFDVMADPDYPVDAVNSNVIVEHIEANGRM